MTIELIKNKINKGETLFAEGKIDEAEQCFLSILKSGYKVDDILNNLGTIAFFRNDFRKSIYYFVNSLRINPFNKPVILNYFETIKASSKFQTILPFLKRYLCRVPDDIEVNQIYKKVLHHIQTQNPNKLCVINEKVSDITKGIFDLNDVKSASIENQALIANIDTILKGVNLNENQINKPHRNLILTGVPSSGISLFFNILNGIENVICFDDIIEDIKLLPQKYANLREKVTKNSSVFIQNSTRDISKDKSCYSNVINEDVVIGLKQNIAYLKLNTMQGLQQNRIETLMSNYGYRIIAIIRDPVHTIACWNDDKANQISETMVTNENMSQRWKEGINFISDNKIERQAQIWEFYAEFFWSLRNMIKIYTYEQITSCLEWVLKDTCNFLVLKRPKIIEPVKNFNTFLHHQKIDEIKKAVKKHCPTLLKFGYQDFWDNNIIPGIWDENDIPNSGQVDFQKCLEQWKQWEKSRET